MRSSRNSIKPFLLIVAPIVFCSIAVADAVPDPQILIDLGGESPSVTTINTVLQPNATGTVACPSGFVGQCFDFLNDTGAIITGFTIQTVVNANLSIADSNSFTCAQGAGHEYFINCSVTYVTSNGSLTYVFDGVLPSDGDEDVLTRPPCIHTPRPPVCDTEAGEREGIPLGGHFLFGLNGYVPGARGGGGGLLFGPTEADAPARFQTTFTTVPEPSMMPILVLGGLAMIVWAKLRRRQSQPLN